MIRTLLLGTMLGLSLVAAIAPPQATYRLGADDKLLFRSADVEELEDKPAVVSRDGFIDLPLVGRIEVAGLTVPEARRQVTVLLAAYYKSPNVSLEITQYGSEPVSVLGAVNHSGIYQLNGRKSLAEVLAMAGGIQPQAGYTVFVKRKESVLSYNLRDILRNTSQAPSAAIEAFDVITVPQAELIYVIGDVHKPGGFALGEREHVSALQALSLAEGPNSTASLGSCSILRSVAGHADRTHIRLDMRRPINGKGPDVDLQAGDILVVPSSSAKKMAIKTAEAALQTASGLVIWRLP